MRAKEFITESSRPPAPHVATGVPIKLYYLHNTESSRKYAKFHNCDYGEQLAPAGEYMVVDYVPLKPPAKTWIAGEISFKNPLVLDHKNTTSTGWKKDLSDMFGGKTGKALSNAVMRKGYDGIITHDSYGLSETVNLKGEKSVAIDGKS
jgi:hypothetical protein